MPDLDVRVEPAIAAHAAEWDALVDQLDPPSAFLRSWWIDATTRDPCIVLVSRGGRLLGGVALDRGRVAGIERLTFAGGGVIGRDHLDVVAAPAERAVVVAAIRTWLARPGSRVVTLDGAPERAAVLDALPGPVRARVIEHAPWASLPATYDEYLAARPSALRNTIVRVGKRLDRDGVRYGVVTPDRLDDALAALERFHSVAFGSTSALLAGFDAFTRAARAGTLRGELRFHELAVDGASIAIEVWIEAAGVGSFYQSGRDADDRWRGSGTLLKARVIEGMIERGIRQIDLLRADAPYKREWAPDARALLAIDASAGWRGRLVVAAQPVARAAGRRTRHVLRPVRRWLRAVGRRG